MPHQTALVMKTPLRGSGCFICRAFKKDIDVDGAWIVVIGLLFWVVRMAGACLSSKSLDGGSLPGRWRGLGQSNRAMRLSLRWA